MWPKHKATNRIGSPNACPQRCGHSASAARRWQYASEKSATISSTSSSAPGSGSPPSRMSASITMTSRSLGSTTRCGTLALAFSPDLLMSMMSLRLRDPSSLSLMISAMREVVSIGIPSASRPRTKKRRSM